MDVEFNISIYPGGIALEDVPAVFTVEYDHGDPSVGDSPGWWATLFLMPFGGLTIDRAAMIRAIGVKALVALETDISERVNADPVSYLPEAA